MPQLGFFHVLLGDEPALAPEVKFYQRLLARDPEEATELAEDYLEDQPLEKLYDAVIMPALGLAEQDRLRGSLERATVQEIAQDTIGVVEELAQDRARRTPDEAAVADAGTILCIGARNALDEAAAAMLAHLLQRGGLGARSVAARRRYRQEPGAAGARRRRADLPVLRQSCGDPARAPADQEAAAALWPRGQDHGRSVDRDADRRGRARSCCGPSGADLLATSLGQARSSYRRRCGAGPARGAGGSLRLKGSLPAAAESRFGRSPQQPLGLGQVLGPVGVEERVDRRGRELDLGQPVAGGPDVDLADGLRHHRRPQLVCEAHRP